MVLIVRTTYSTCSVRHLALSETLTHNPSSLVVALQTSLTLLRYGRISAANVLMKITALSRTAVPFPDTHVRAAITTLIRQIQQPEQME